MVKQILQRLKAGDFSGLSGTDIAISLPISGSFVQTILTEQVKDPLKGLSLRLMAEDRCILNLAVDAPVVGLTQRELALEIHGDIIPGQQDWLHFDIVDGLKFFDKPLINLGKGMIAEKLPGGVELSSKRLSIHFSQLFGSLGFGYLLPAIAAARLNSERETLILHLHLKIQ